MVALALCHSDKCWMALSLLANTAYSYFSLDKQ